MNGFSDIILNNTIPNNLNSWHLFPYQQTYIYGCVSQEPCMFYLQINFN